MSQGYARLKAQAPIIIGIKWPDYTQVNAQGQYEILSATVLLQLHFNSFPDVHLASNEVILCSIKKIVLSLYGVTSSEAR